MESDSNLIVADGSFELQGIYEQLKLIDEAISVAEDGILHEEVWIERVKYMELESSHERCFQHSLGVLQRINQSLIAMLGVQSYLRSNAILRSRPSFHRLHILDLPDGTLLLFFLS